MHTGTGMTMQMKEKACRTLWRDARGLHCHCLCGFEAVDLKTVCDVLPLPFYIVPPLIQSGRARQASQGTQLLLSVDDPLTDRFIHLSLPVFGVWTLECLLGAILNSGATSAYQKDKVPALIGLITHGGTQIIDRDIKYNVLWFFGGEMKQNTRVKV